MRRSSKRKACGITPGTCHCCGLIAQAPSRSSVRRPRPLRAKLWSAPASSNDYGFLIVRAERPSYPK